MYSIVKFWRASTFKYLAKSRQKIIIVVVHSLNTNRILYRINENAHFQFSITQQGDVLCKTERL